MAKKCPSCGITTGRGKRHKAGCAEKKSGITTKTVSKATSSGFRIDGRTPIPKLLNWLTEIEAELKQRKPAEIKAVKKAIDEIDALEEKLAEAKRLAGM